MFLEINNQELLGWFWFGVLQAFHQVWAADIVSRLSW